MIDRFAAEIFSDLKTASFSTKKYSELKFGSDLVAKEFGNKMADLFYERHLDVLIHDHCVVVPSAFNVVEIAATILAQRFMARLNDRLSRDGHRKVEWTTMHRTMSYVADYAYMDRRERERMLDGDRLYINRDFIHGKTILFVDDVTITGAHERKIRSFMDSSFIDNKHVFCYYAAYDGDRADIEAELNHSGVSTIDEYLRIVNEPGHRLVVRAVRFLLDVPTSELRKALGMLDDRFVESLYSACLAKGYDSIPEYADGFRMIRDRHDGGLDGN